MIYDSKLFLEYKMGQDVSSNIGKFSPSKKIHIDVAQMVDAMVLNHCSIDIVLCDLIH